MPDYERLRTDSGDERLDENARGGASIPGTPGYESEAAFRHKDIAEANMTEIGPNQLAPFPLDDSSEEGATPTIEANRLKFRDDDRHRSK